MSKKCLFERATGLFEDGATFDDLAHDEATHIQITLPDYPDRRSERWDGGLGVRAASAQEIADYDDADKDTRASGDLNMAVNKALRDLLLDIEQRLRAAGQTSTLPDIAAATTKAEFTAALKTIVKSYL